MMNMESKQSITGETLRALLFPTKAARPILLWRNS